VICVSQIMSEALPDLTELLPASSNDANSGGLNVFAPDDELLKLLA